MMEMNRHCTDQDIRQTAACSDTRRKIERCPLCGDMILAGWEKCRRCGEPLGGASPSASGFVHSVPSLNRKGLLHLAGSSQLRPGAIRQCSLCGDMVSIEWAKCPRCHEPVANPFLP